MAEKDVIKTLIYHGINNILTISQDVQNSVNFFNSGLTNGLMSLKDE